MRAAADSLPVQHDTEVEHYNPRAVNGARGAMKIDGRSHKKALLQFDLSALPTAIPVAKASLRVFVRRVHQAGDLDIYVLNSAWNESRVNALTFPQLGVPVASMSIDATSEGEFVTIDLTGLVQSWIDGTVANNGIALISDHAQPVSVVLDTKEGYGNHHSASIEVIPADGSNGRFQCECEDGAPGPAGPTGPTGPTGPQGPQGDVGPQGPQGEVGPIGPMGAVGPPGPQGPQGEQGLIGPIGPQGIQGDEGPMGPIGPIGPAGPQGPQGDQGPIGPAGPQGPQGPMGPQGDQGPVGPIGPAGPQGDQGPVGPMGPIGPAGPQGDQGPVGPMGPIGPAGPQGDQGPIGPMGAIGPAGPQGDQGPMGPIGPTGPQGPQGEQGPTGPTGPQGEPGADGAIGPTGPQGPRGLDAEIGCPSGLVNGICLVDYNGTNTTTWSAAVDHCASRNSQLCSAADYYALRQNFFWGNLFIDSGPVWTRDFSDNDGSRLSNIINSADDPTVTNPSSFACCHSYTPQQNRARAQRILPAGATSGGILVTFVHNLADTSWPGAAAVCRAHRSELCTKSEYVVVRDAGLISPNIPVWTPEMSDNDGNLFNAIVGPTSDNPLHTTRHGYACCAHERAPEAACPGQLVGQVCVGTVHDSEDSDFFAASRACAAQGANICSKAQMTSIRAAGGFTSGSWTNDGADNDSTRAGGLLSSQPNNPDPANTQLGYACCY